MNKKMNTKRTLVSFLLIASVLLLASAVSAASIGTSSEAIKVNDVVVSGTPADVASVIVGDTMTVQVKFNATASGSDVRVKATLEGEKADVSAVTSYFDVIAGKTYVKTLTLKVPAEIESDKISGTLPLNVRIWNSDLIDTELPSMTLTTQRPAYSVAIKSVMVSSNAEAGKTLPVEVVLKNDGYNDLKDMYVTVKVAELGVEKQVYFGDLYNVETTVDDDHKNSVRGTFNLEIPSDAKAGKYTLTVVAKNDDTTNTATQDLTIASGIADLAMKSGSDLILLNPTSQLQVYTVKYNSNEQAVVMSAESSKTVPITVPTSGDYKFDVSVYSGEKLLSTVNYAGTAEASTQLTSPVFVLTVILAIVFLVLLVVLVVLITKKPQKTEEFGESYY